jgi:Transcriptional regulator, AbiEi antitoxin
LIFDQDVDQPTPAERLFDVMAADLRVWAEIVRVARAQNGVITADQLRATGLTRAALRTRVARGHLQRLHHGVYAIGDPALLPLAAVSAAVLAVGQEHAVVSHRSAAALWGLIPRVDPPIHDVTLAKGGFARDRAGVRIHRVGSLHPLDVSTRHNLRLTAPARTLIDFATEAAPAELEQALTEARIERLVTDSRLDAALNRVPANHAGARCLRSLLTRPAGRAVTRSKLERSFLALVDAAGLPRPLVNVRLHGHEPDFFWPQHMLVVELDGYASHGIRSAFERDRRRDQDYAAAGIQVVRATDLQLDLEPVALAVRIARALATRATPAG